MAGLVALAMLGSCAGPGGEGSAPPDLTTTTATPVVTTTTSPAVTTSVFPGTSTVAPTTMSPGSMPTPEDGPSGSGCTPGDAATLPEGEWFGFVSATSLTGIEFDLACWFSGQAAIDAAAEDNEESPPPNDYYVRNDNPQTRSLGVAAEAQVLWYPTGDPNTTEVAAFPNWVDGVAGRGFQLGVWLEVIDGQVLAIREQWVP